MKPFNAHLLFFFLIISFTSCTVQKRVHQPGFHIEWANTKSYATENAKTTQNIIIENKFTEAETTILSSVGEHSYLFSAVGFEQAPAAPDCDTIKLKTGTVIVAIIKGIKENTYIEYSDCAEEGNSFFINKKDVKQLTYRDGRTEHFETEHSDNIPANQSVDRADKEIHNLSFISVFAAFISFFIMGLPLGITAAVCGFAGAVLTAKEPDKYKGLGLAFLGILIGTIAIVLTLSYLVTH